MSAILKFGNFLIDDVELKKQLSVEKPIVKGYNFYKSGKVQGIYTKRQEELFYIKSQVKSSYDKQADKHKNIYTVKIIMDTNSQVQQAVCPCSGNDGQCNHLAATLFAMEDACKKSVSTTSESEDDLPCTSKPCTWSIPKKRKQEPSTVQAVKFVKHVYGKKDKECSSSSTVHTTHNKKKSNTDYNALLEKIKAVEEKTGRKIGLHYIIPQQVPEYSTTVTKETPQPSKWDIVSPIKTAPLSMLGIAQKSLRSKTRLYDSIKDRNDITEATKEQHLTRTWYDVRKPRITASKCKRCLIRPTTSPTEAISEVLMYNDRAPTKAMKEGIEAESRIISEFEKDTGLTVHKSGFVISETHPFLGASPDGIIDNHTIVEVKNIQVKEAESHEDAMCRLGIYKKHGSAIEINKNHGYYHQIQQQLFCTQSNSCHFIVSSAISTHREVITFDSGFWNDILPKLENFYFNHLFPELVYPRIFHSEMRWNKVVEFPRSL